MLHWLSIFPWWVWIIILILIILLICRIFFGPVRQTEYRPLTFEKLEKGISNHESYRSASVFKESRNEVLGIFDSRSVSSFTSEELHDFYSCKRPFIGKGSIGERACRAFLQRHFNLPFESCRPDFLVNPETGRALEYDCYEGSIRLAIEFQGEGHYKYIPYFHKTYKAFEEQQRKDEFKAEMSSRLGITLIRVPYNIPLDQIPEFIRERLPPHLKRSVTNVL